MPKNKDEIQEIKQLYLNPGISLAQIRRVFNLTDAELKKIVKENSWDVLRNSKKVTKSQLLQSSFQQLDALHKLYEKNKHKATDAQLKQEAMILKKIEQFSDHHLSYFIDIGLEFIDFLASKNPEFSVKVGEQYDMFIQYKSGQQK